MRKTLRSDSHITCHLVCYQIYFDLHLAVSGTTDNGDGSLGRLPSQKTQHGEVRAELLCHMENILIWLPEDTGEFSNRSHGKWFL